MDKGISTGALTSQARNELKEELNQAYSEEEIFWKQKSRVMWLRAGDETTRYFHSITKSKRLRNTISSIQDAQGVIHKRHREVAELAQQYFQDMYSASNINRSLVDEVFQGFQKKKE